MSCDGRAKSQNTVGAGDRKRHCSQRERKLITVQQERFGGRNKNGRSRSYSERRTGEGKTRVQCKRLTSAHGTAVGTYSCKKRVVGGPERRWQKGVRDWGKRFDARHGNLVTVNFKG